MANSFFEKLERAAPGDSVALAAALDALAFDERGLIPAIAQRHDTGEIVMFAWMNRTAVDETLTTGHVCYYSRSRGTLWRKGEESGHVQRLRELRIDCDGDVLLLTVEQTGPACHTGRRSCFYLKVDGDRVTVVDAPERDPSDMYRR
jgi:phosphoribosyl-AMP cyclohydrolase